MDKTKELYDFFNDKYNYYSKELQQIEQELNMYEDKSSNIVVKKINGNKYYYEQWREGNKIKGKALGKVSPSAVYEIEIEINKRRDLHKRAEELRFLIDCVNKERKELYRQILEDSYEDNYNFEVFWKNELSARVSVYNSRVHVSRYIFHPVRQIFSSDNISRNQLNEVLKLRCFEEGRADIHSKLIALGLMEYNPLEIVKRTHGVSYNDYIWIRFPGENITAEDVLVR